MDERLSVTSGRLNEGEGQVWTGKIVLKAITINTDKTNDVTITLYDGNSPKAKNGWGYRVPGPSDGTGRNFTNLLFENGLYYKLEGSGSYCYIEKMA